MDREAYNIILCYVCRGVFSDVKLCTLRLCACVRLSRLRSIFCSLLCWSAILHMLHYVLQVLNTQLIHSIMHVHTMCIEAAVHTIAIEADLKLKSNSAAGVEVAGQCHGQCHCCYLGPQTYNQMRSAHDVMESP